MSSRHPWICRGAAAIALVAIVAWTSTTGFASTVDRDYLLGENSGVSTENGVAGAGVGTGSGSDHPGFTLDHAGTLTNLATFQDLEANGGLTYIDVAASGLARPGASAGSLGVNFDGVNDYLRGNGFGNPAQGDNPYETTISYNGLNTRAMQGWVRPTTPSAAGQRQRVVHDTQRFGISIVADNGGVNRWALNFDGVAATNEVVSSSTVQFNQWSHVMQFSNGTYAALYVNGVAVAAKFGVAQANSGTTSEQAFILGADNAGDAPAITSSNFFKGQIDNFQVLVAGNNSTQTAGANYGPFNLGVDNQYVALQQLVPGDVTGDGLITGDGTGGANDDVAKFVSSFLYNRTVDGVVLGDSVSRTQHADLNFDGRTNLQDWYILTSNHTNAASLDLATLLSAQVPEPASTYLMLTAVVGLLLRRRPRC